MEVNRNCHTVACQTVGEKRNYRHYIATDRIQPNGYVKKCHPNETSNDRLWDKDRRRSGSDESAPDVPDKPEYRNMTLCKFCCSALSRGRYTVRRIDSCYPRLVRSCDLCHTRTRCGEYEVSVERHEKVEHVNWRVREKLNQQNADGKSQTER